MSGLTQTFQVARTETIGKRAINFARLEVGTDLAQFAANIVADRKATARRLVDEQNASLDARMHVGRFELLSILQKIEDPTNEPSISEIYAIAGTPTGAKRICKRMMVKGGITEPDAESLLSQMLATDMGTFAQNGVLCAPVPDEKKEDTTPPLPSTPAGSAAPTTQPGVPSEAELLARAVGYQSQDNESPASPSTGQPQPA